MRIEENYYRAALLPFCKPGYQRTLKKVYDTCQKNGNPEIDIYPYWDNYVKKNISIGRLFLNG